MIIFVFYLFIFISYFIYLFIYSNNIDEINYNNKFLIDLFIILLLLFL